MSDNNYECDGDNFDNVYLAWQYTIFSTKNKPECIIEHSKKIVQKENVHANNKNKVCNTNEQAKH